MLAEGPPAMLRTELLRLGSLAKDVYDATLGRKKSRSGKFQGDAHNTVRHS